ncbi:hypothetical protein V6N13_120052 [Hibiscus sabdariffa]|uniref:Uncharacterized protein n=1 Tax=Hibiscus sabdariffa TaxID=183260 RepID=A0ABR2A5H6_9ROSI
MDPDPPLHETYKALFANTKIFSTDNDDRRLVTVEERELPLIDLSRLSLNEAEQKQCKEEIARAGHEWGFFQVINHGISMELLEKLREEQVRVFKQPFRNKFLNFSDGSYRWGTPTATSLRQLSWSEAFHIPMTDISSSMEPFATKAWSNGFYISVEHCVLTHPTEERFSVAYFLCPSYDTVIESCSQPSVYSKFSFREYRQKVQEDVQRYGHKVTADVYAILSALEMITEHGSTDSKPILFTESESSPWVLERNLRPYWLWNLFMDIDRSLYLPD